MEANLSLNRNLLTLFGFIVVACIVLAFSHAATLTQPRTISRPIAKPDMVQMIYRGVPFGHRYYQDALEGKAIPFGGHSVPGLHRDGNNNSVFTSWTTNIAVAYEYATTGLNGKCEGVILIKKVNMGNAQFINSDQMPGGDVFNESEVLVKGMLTGAIPVIVKPEMTSAEISKLIKSVL